MTILISLISNVFTFLLQVEVTISISLTLNVFTFLLQVTISPNAVNNCCQLGSDQMGTEIVQAAKEIVAR